MQSERTTWFIIALLAAAIGLITFFEWPVVSAELMTFAHTPDEPMTVLDVLTWCALILIALPAMAVAVVLRLREEKSEQAEWNQFQAWKAQRNG